MHFYPGTPMHLLSGVDILQWIDVKGVPGDSGVLLLPPSRGEITGNAGGEAELMHAMAQHVQRV